MSDDVPSPGSTGIRQWFKRVLRSLGSKPAGRDEIIELIKEAGEREIFDKDAQEMLEGVLEVSEGQVRDVMIPRSQMVVVERDAPPEGILPVIIESGHSRFPVIGDDKDEVVGILLAKDLLRFFIEGDRKNFDLPLLSKTSSAVRPLRSTGVAPLPRYYEPRRHPLAFHRFPGFASYTASLLRRFLDGTRRASPVA